MPANGNGASQGAKGKQFDEVKKGPVELRRVSDDCRNKVFDESHPLPRDPTDAANLSDEDEEYADTA